MGHSGYVQTCGRCQSVWNGEGDKGISSNDKEGKRYYIMIIRYKFKIRDGVGWEG